MKLLRHSFTYKDSQCSVISDKQAGVEAAVASVKRNFELLADYVEVHPWFRDSLEPVDVPDEPLAARLMAEAAAKAHVGPMAAVAGVLADLAVKDMLAAGCKVAVVEDGGEISAVSNVPVDVAVAAGDEPLSRQFGFRLKEFPCGVATSSGRFSHAFSFGEAEAAVVFCSEAGLADAAATAVCNVVKGNAVDAAISKGLEVAKSIAGVNGTLILFRGCVGTWGKIPQIIQVEPSTG